MKKSNIKMGIKVNAILLAVMITADLIEYYIASLIDFHYPSWTIPAAIRGMTMKEAYILMMHQPWWWIATAMSLVFLFWITPKVFYPVLEERSNKR